MNWTRSLRIARVLTLGIPVAAFPEDAATPPAASAPVDHILKDVSPSQYLPAWFQVGVQLRGRFESPSGTSLANSSSDSYYLSRIRVDLTVKPVPWLKFFVQAQDARVGAYNTAPAPTTLYNPMDLRQGYVAFSSEGTWGLQFRAGRQDSRWKRGRASGK